MFFHIVQLVKKKQVPNECDPNELPAYTDQEEENEVNDSKYWNIPHEIENYSETEEEEPAMLTCSGD